MVLSGEDIINRLRNEQFNIETESKLEDHPYIKTAIQGSLTTKQKLAFCIEQYSIQRSDAISFAFLAGHTDFKPKTLTGIQVPQRPKDSVDDDDDDTKIPNLFQFLLGGEIIAAPLLLKYAKYLLKLDNDEKDDDKEENGDSTATTTTKVEQQLSKYETSPLAQAYPSYWARIAVEGSSTSRIAGAAACAVNFPAWGKMCSRLHDALLLNSSDGKSDSDNSNIQQHLEFIKFFATPIDNLDGMASAIINRELLNEQKQKQQDGGNGNGNDDDDDVIDYDIIKNHVRLLQQYEVFFWDAIYGS